MRNTRAGFTLMEILLAMTLMAMLAGTLYASLHIGFRARDSIQAALDETNAGELALDLVRRDFCEALPPKGILAGTFMGNDEQWDNGRDADNMSFYACANTLDEPFGSCDVIHVVIGLGTDDDGTVCLVRRTTTNLLATEVPEPDVEVLCRNVRALNLRYFDGTDWLDSWDSTQEGDELPLAVELTMELKPRKGQTSDTLDAMGRPQGPVLTRVLVSPCASLPEGTNLLLPSSGR